MTAKIPGGLSIMNNDNVTEVDRAVEERLSLPPAATVECVKRLDGDYLVLGVGGKMGTTMALMLRRALAAAGRHKAVVTGVSRFSRPLARDMLEQCGVRTLACDLAEPDQVATLPQAANVLYLAGQKFGTSDAPELTWIQNTIAPALVARHYRAARIVAFSTGCVYPFAPIDGPGSNESDPVAFLGEYASSCVGRERVFTCYAKRLGTRLLIFRLNYATEFRYGVLVDIAGKVQRGEPIDVTTGWLNCIWQGDACARAIQCLEHVANPPLILNVTGPEKLSVRALATEFGRRLGRDPVIVGHEDSHAWLSDAIASMRLFGPPTVSVEGMIGLVADHVRGGGALLNKPTHFETRTGEF